MENRKMVQKLLPGIEPLPLLSNEQKDVKDEALQMLLIGLLLTRDSLLRLSAPSQREGVQFNLDTQEMGELIAFVLSGMGNPIRSTLGLRRTLSFTLEGYLRISHEGLLSFQAEYDGDLVEFPQQEEACRALMKL